MGLVKITLVTNLRSSEAYGEKFTQIVPQRDVDSVYAHYDPESIKINTTYNWEDSETLSDASPSPNKKGKQTPLLNMTLRFDDITYKDIKQNTAQSITKLYFMASKSRAELNEGGSTLSPVICNLGKLLFKGVITKLDVEITGTDSSLRPIRASVDIEIKQLNEAEDETELIYNSFV